MRLRVLGALRLDGPSGSAVEIKAKKAKALLAWLALQPRRAETRERLAALLWSGMGEERARANLRQAISVLREALEDPDGRVLESADDLLRLEEAALEVDACALRRLARSDDPADWRRGLELYQGELLADLAVGEEPFEEWLAAERRELRQIACGLWSRLAAALRRAGDDDGAEGALIGRLSLDPACEEAHRALMELYRATGRRAKALEQFERCRGALGQAFGVGPDDATLALHRAIVEAPPAAPPRLPLPAKPSIAVLPFSTAAPDESWLGDGIAEDVIIALSRFDRLFVIARQSSFTFRGRDADVREIGRALGVHYVLGGSVRREAGRLGLRIQLADAETGQAVWGHAYEVSAGELFEAQREIVQVVVATLAGRVEADRIARLRRRPDASLEAYDCLLKAKAHHHRYTAEDNALARACLERALALDPELSLAHAWMACVLVQGNSFRPMPRVFEMAYEHVQRAVALDEDDSECHRILASYYLIHKRHDESERHQARALALNPNDDRIVCQQGELLTFLGQADLALPWIERAMRLNPYCSDSFYSDHGRALYHAGDPARARRQLLAIRAPRPAHHAYIAACCVRLGDRTQAQAYAREALRASPGLGPERFVGGLPYKTAAAATTLLDDLRAIWPA